MNRPGFTGRFSQIDDPDLRRHLASLEVWVQDAAENQEIGRQIRVEQVMPPLGPYRPVSTGGVTGSLLRSPEGRLESTHTTDFSNRPEIRAALRTKNGWYRVGLGELQRLLERLEETRALLLDELEATAGSAGGAR